MPVPRPYRGAKDLFAANRCFKHLLAWEGSPVLVNDIADLTGLCFPQIKAGAGQSHIRYEWGIVVVPRGEDRLALLETAICERRMLCLHRTLPPSKSLESFIRDGEASPWMINRMAEDMARYTLPAEEALALIGQQDDELIGRLVALYGSDFDDLVLRPLEAMID